MHLWTGTGMGGELGIKNETKTGVKLEWREPGIHSIQWARTGRWLCHVPCPPPLKDSYPDNV